MALARSRETIHCLRMSHNHSAQHRLTHALIDATCAPDAPEFMSADAEAMALRSLYRTVDTMIASGFVPVTKLMTLCQQALRVAAVAVAREQEREEVVQGLLGKTVPN
mgnify:CR=1 FL=1